MFSRRRPTPFKALVPLRVCGLSLTATFMAAALTASGTAAPQMNHTCSNGGYLQRWRTANDLFTGAVQSIKAGCIVAAAAYVQRARKRVQSAPPPCNSQLLVARAHTLKEYAETLLYLRALDDGDIASSIVYLQRALHEQDVVAPLLAPYRSRAGTVRAAGP